MILIAFLVVASLLNLGLGVSVQLRSYRKHQSLWFLGLSTLVVLHLWLGMVATGDFTLPHREIALRSILLVDLLICFGILQVARRFLHGNDSPDAGLLGFSGPRPWRILISINLLAMALAALPTGHALDLKGQAAFSWIGSWIPATILLNAVGALYLLENTYRFAEEYQRRIGRLVFIGLFWLCGFHILAFGRALLYRTLPPHYIEASSVVYGVVFPVVLLGFLRYRLGSERITIPRDTVYSSVTLFMTGAAFLAVAVTVTVFQALSVDFNQFEMYLGGFSLCFIAVLALGSGTMRRRISRFVNARLYSSKYDYQDQFFRLHRAIAAEGDVQGVVTELVENMKYSVTVEDAFCFLRNPQDGDFYVHQNKEASFRGDLKLSGDSPLVRVFEEEGPPLDFKAPLSQGGARMHAARGEALLLDLNIDAAFPIRVGSDLVGVLALQGGKRQVLDAEDLALIGAFATSIGDVVFKSRVLEARIEQKQFESFHHVASFIIHDIKNQIATLNLLLRNADRNMENPAFQRSMLTSVRSSATSLQGLIDRLAVAPRQPEAINRGQPIRPVLENVAQNSGLRQIEGLRFELNQEGREGEGVGGEELSASFDSQSLFFVVKNLIQNALEAMGNQGALSIHYGSLVLAIPDSVRSMTGGGDRFFTGFSAYVMVRDQGPGMDPEFVRKRLFQPFATTKEKGVGIGLYQCRTLMEKMGGRILCRSEKGMGTTFCLLLPAGGTVE